MHTLVAAFVGIAAAQANATPSVKAKLKHGALEVTGTKANDRIALRLQAGRPGTLQVDVGDDGSADFSFDRAGVATITVGAQAGDDLTGTGVSSVIVDLAGALGATGDGEPDRLVVNGTNGNDAIDVSGDASVVKVSGLAPTVRALHPEAANDRLEINTLAGTDTVETVGLAAGAIQLIVNGVPVP